MNKITVNDRIEFAAQCGAMELYLFVWENTAKKLRDDGLVLEETAIASSRKGEKYYHIVWKDAVVENLPEEWTVDEILKLHWDLSQAQLLWLMAKEQQIRNERQQIDN